MIISKQLFLTHLGFVPPQIAYVNKFHKLVVVPCDKVPPLFSFSA